MKKAQKALAAPLAPVLLALLIGFSSGQWDFEVIAVGASGFVAALIVYLVPNNGAGHTEDQADPEENIHRDQPGR